MNFYAVDRDSLAECVAVFINVFNHPPWNESWEAEAVTERLEDCYNTPGFYGLIAQHENRAVGFAIGFIERWDKSRLFYLKEMCVIPAQQGHGIGTALMNVLQENLKQRGVDKIYLHTARDTFAHAFYEKQGFYVSPKMILMSKWLKTK